jgi:hypothetical protein
MNKIFFTIHKGLNPLKNPNILIQSYFNNETGSHGNLPPPTYNILATNTGDPIVTQNGEELLVL